MKLHAKTRLQASPKEAALIIETLKTRFEFKDVQLHGDDASIRLKTHPLLVVQWLELKTPFKWDYIYKAPVLHSENGIEVHFSVEGEYVLCKIST